MEKPKYSIADFWYLLLSEICLQLTSSQSSDSTQDDIECLRTLAEVLVWSEQNKQTFFKYFPGSQFCEYEIPKAIMEMLTRAEDRKVAVQIIQTMSIICQNLNEESIYALLERSFLQKFVAYPFDFSDEETSEYYITWVKGLALRMSLATIRFFVSEEGSPLLERTVQFSSHSDSMVSTAARTAILSVIRRIAHTDKHPSVPVLLRSLHFYPQLACLVRTMIYQIDQDLAELQFRSVKSRLEDLEDTLLYCKDLMVVQEGQIEREMETSLLYYAVLPLVIGVFAQDHMQSQRISAHLSIGLVLMLLDLFKEEHIAAVVMSCLYEDQLPEIIVSVMKADPPFPPAESQAFTQDLRFEALREALFSSWKGQRMEENVVFGELTDLFRSKFPGLVLLLFRLSDTLLFSGASNLLCRQKKVSLAHKLLSLLTTDDQSSLSILVPLVHLLTRCLKDIDEGRDRAIGELSSATARLRERLGLVEDSSSAAIAEIARNWQELKTLWLAYKPASPVDVLSSGTTETEEEGLNTELKRFMLLTNMKALVLGTTSAFSFEVQTPVFLSYRSSYDWEEGRTYSVPVTSLYPCSLYFGPLSKSQVAYILDDDYYFIVLKPNTTKLGVGEVVYFQELTATSFQMARKESRRILLHLHREKPVDFTLRFEEHAKAWDIYESLIEKQNSAREFEKSLINSLLFE